MRTTVLVLIFLSLTEFAYSQKYEFASAYITYDYLGGDDKHKIIIIFQDGQIENIPLLGTPSSDTKSAPIVLENERTILQMMSSMSERGYIPWSTELISRNVRLCDKWVYFRKELE